MNEKTKNNVTAKLFNIGNLYEHLLDLGHYIYMDEKHSICTRWASWEPAKFSLFYSPDIKETLKKPFPYDVDITPYLGTQVAAGASIHEIMDYLASNKIVTDGKIIKAWNTHKEWHEDMDSKLFCIGDFCIEGCPDERRNIYEYDDTAIIQNFVLLFLCVTEISFPNDFDSQQKILDEVTFFVVDELIPTLNRFEISDEQFQKLLEPAYRYTSQLFWIYSL